MYRAMAATQLIVEFMFRSGPTIDPFNSFGRSRITFSSTQLKSFISNIHTNIATVIYDYARCF